MKKYLLIAAAALITSCSSTSSNPPVQVEYTDGEIEYVKNPEQVDLKPGDSVIVKYYSSNTSLYSSKEIYGRYRGKIRNPSIDSLYIMTYQLGIVVKVSK